MGASRKPPLKYISDEQAGYTRIPWGRGFTYRDTEGKRISDKASLQRFKDLVIPPAWKEVWICPEEKGYLQVTGRDEKDRKQYIYHPKWVEYRQAQKFDHIVEFADHLPLIRQTVRKHLKDKTWTKRKMMALILEVLDETALRIGNRIYKERNNTFGLTTLRRKHLTVSEKNLTLSFKGKSNQYREVAIDNKRLIRLIKDCSELPGYEIFRYQDAEGKYQLIDSQDVNEYLQVITGKEFSSKDFRTWYATASAVDLWPKINEEHPDLSMDKRLANLVKSVAQKLGNTVSVCRKYYIHPKVLRQFEKRTIDYFNDLKLTLPEPFMKEMDEAECLAFQLIKQK
ncbi:DNA topoisomerase IB [Flavilitoribacter nigricans]|uniref:DNA topoisomerase n=1 Tax=Flavilitoribacter nigricans (strain ATCC 23147 / DSM 23189 / NBRC 102662 / NCIMB 1420 / SS-2) TaxID=1122177 RepID=A0A2D0N9J8_FLAN2|nr:DNA topoisomerase IB [Flavilitoribacter nigricans]PHN05058.1 DNA topoisomerase I [Flavilitoribacter nigricans DSM 23189 = NBRC 102662]